jgi:hypothetical protein
MDLSPLDRKEATKHAMQLWVVTGTEAKSSKGYTTNIRVGVAAHSIEEAIEAAKKKYPGCKILSAQHQGPIEIVVETL